MFAADVRPGTGLVPATPTLELFHLPILFALVSLTYCREAVCNQTRFYQHNSLWPWHSHICKQVVLALDQGTTPGNLRCGGLNDMPSPARLWCTDSLIGLNCIVPVPTFAFVSRLSYLKLLSLICSLDFSCFLPTSSCFHVYPCSHVKYPWTCWDNLILQRTRNTQWHTMQRKCKTAFLKQDQMWGRFLRGGF